VIIGTGSDVGETSSPVQIGESAQTKSLQSLDGKSTLSLSATELPEKVLSQDRLVTTRAQQATVTEITAKGKETVESLKSE
jgi:hypothetical protein